MNLLTGKIAVSGKGLGTALVCVAALSASVAEAQQICSNSTGTNNGFYYSFWKDSGDACITLGSAGNYSSSWTNATNNWVGGKGWNPGARRVINYSAPTARTAPAIWRSTAGPETRWWNTTSLRTGSITIRARVQANWVPLTSMAAPTISTARSASTSPRLKARRRSISTGASVHRSGPAEPSTLVFISTVGHSPACSSARMITRSWQPKAIKAPGAPMSL